MRAVDAMGASGAGRIQTFKASDLAELARVSEEAWRRIEAREPAYALRLTRAALLEGVLDVRREVEGRNVQTNAWRTAKWQALRDGTSLRITHLEVGTGSGTPNRADTGISGALAPRKAVTDVVVDGDEYLRTSTFLTSADYAGQTLTRGGLWTSITGGTLVNHLAWASPLEKLATESAIAEINLREVPV